MNRYKHKFQNLIWDTLQSKVGNGSVQGFSTTLKITIVPDEIGKENEDLTVVGDVVSSKKGAEKSAAKELYNQLFSLQHDNPAGTL